MNRHTEQSLEWMRQGWMLLTPHAPTLHPIRVYPRAFVLCSFAAA